MEGRGSRENYDQCMTIGSEGEKKGNEDEGGAEKPSKTRRGRRRKKGEKILDGSRNLVTHSRFP